MQGSDEQTHKQKNIELKSKAATNSVPVKELALNELVDDAAIIMIAKRGSGKSWIVRSIIYHYASRIPMHMIISCTDDVNPFYKDFIPDIYVHFKFDSDVIKGILNRQQQMKNKNKRREEEGKKQVNSRCLIVMDDCLAENSWIKDETVRILLFNGRHYKITYILTMQYPLGIKPDQRTNFDYIFLLADDTYSNQKRIFDHYAGIFPNFESFRQIFRQLTDDFGAMVILNRAKSGTSAIDKIRYYKAPDLSETKITIGGRQYNKFHNDNYNKNWEDNHAMFDDKVDKKFEKSHMKEKGLVVKKIRN